MTTPAAVQAAHAAALRELLQISNHDRYREALTRLGETAFEAGRSAGHEARADEIEAEIDVVAVELEALAARFDRAALRMREEAEGGTDRAAHQHGTAAGLELAARWLRSALDRVLPDEADDAAA